MRAALCATLRRWGAHVRDAGHVPVARLLVADADPGALLVVDDACIAEHDAFLREWLTEPRRRALVLGDRTAIEALPSARVAVLDKPFTLDVLLIGLADLCAEPPPAPAGVAAQA